MHMNSIVTAAKRRLQFTDLTSLGFARFDCRKVATGDPCLAISKEVNEQAGGGGDPDREGNTAVTCEDEGGDDADPDSRRSKKGTRQPSPALLPFNALSAYVSFGRSRIYQLIQEGSFPRPIKIGKSSRWVVAEINRWLENQIALRQIQMVGGRND